MSAPLRPERDPFADLGGGGDPFADLGAARRRPAPPVATPSVAPPPEGQDASLPRTNAVSDAAAQLFVAPARMVTTFGEGGVRIADRIARGLGARRGNVLERIGDALRLNRYAVDAAGEPETIAGTVSRVASELSANALPYIATAGGSALPAVLAKGSALTAVQAQAGRDASTVGAIADLTDDEGFTGRLERIANNPAARTVADVGIDLTAGAALPALRALRQARRGAPAAADAAVPPMRALPPGQYEMGPATTRIEPETRPERLLPPSPPPTPTVQYEGGAGPAIPMGPMTSRLSPETDPARLLRALSESAPRPVRAYDAPAGPGIPMPRPGGMTTEQAIARADELRATPDDIERYRITRDLNAPVRDRVVARSDAAQERAAITAESAASAGTRHVARSAAGRLPSNLKNVSTEALERELAQQYERQSLDEGLVASIEERPEFMEAFQMPGMREDRLGVVIDGKPIGEFNQELATTVGRVASRRKAIERLEAELATRRADPATAFPFGKNAPTESRPFSWNHDPADGPLSVEGWKVTTPSAIRAEAAALRFPGEGADAELADMLDRVARVMDDETNVADALRQVAENDAARYSDTSLDQAERALRVLRGDEATGPSGALRNRPGAVPLSALTPLATTVVGGAAGAASAETPEDAVVSGAAGALAGFGVGAGLPALIKRGSAPVSPADARKRVAEAVKAMRATKSGPVAGHIGAQPSTPPSGGSVSAAERATAREHFNLDRVTRNLPPEDEARFIRKVLEVAPTAQGRPKTVVPWTETRAQAARILNASPRSLDDLDWQRMTGAEGLALASIVRENTEQVGALLAERAAASGTRLKEIDAALADLDAQTTGTLRTLMKGTSEQGRQLNAAKILANLDRNPTAWLLRAQRAKGPDLPLTVEEMAKVQGLVAAGDTRGLATYLSGLQRATIPEKIATLRKAGLLTGIKGRVLDLIGTGFNGVLDAVDRGPAVVVDALVAKSLSLAKGGDASRFRTVAGLSGQEARAYGTGLVRGADGAWESIGGKAFAGGGSWQDRLTRWSDAVRAPDFDAKLLARLDIPHVVNFDNPAIDTYAKLAMRMSGLPDKVWGRAYYESALVEQARVWAMREGAKDVGARAKEILKSPPDELVADAVLTTDELTFRNAGYLATLAQGLKRLPSKIAARTPGVRPEVARELQGVANAATDWVLAFTRTPSNIAGRVADYTLTPVTLARAAVNLREAVALTAVEGAGSPAARRAQRKAVQLIARATTGAAGVMALGAYLESQGLMTGAWPQDPREAEAWRAQGKQANSVLLGGGWVPVSRLAPGGTAMAVGATLASASRRDGGGVPSLPTAAAAVGSGVLDQPMMTGPRELLEALDDPEGKAARWASREAGSLVPTIVADVARATSGGGIVRRPDGLVEGVQARLAPQSVRARLDVFGDEVRGASGLSTVVNPLAGSPDRTQDDPVREEMARIGVTLSAVGRKRGESDEAWDDRQRREGRAVHQAIGSLLMNPAYLALSDEDRRTAWENVVTRVRRTVR